MATIEEITLMQEAFNRSDVRYVITELIERVDTLERELQLTKEKLQHVDMRT